MGLNYTSADLVDALRLSARLSGNLEPGRVRQVALGL
jgi:hypothetical protein